MVLGVSGHEHYLFHSSLPTHRVHLAPSLTLLCAQEYNCVNFSCRLRDWARLGQLVAQKGKVCSQGAADIPAAAGPTIPIWPAVQQDVGEMSLAAAHR